MDTVTKSEGSGLKLDWTGILTAGLLPSVVLLMGSIMQYGILSNRVSSIEAQMVQGSASNQAIMTVTNSLQNTIVKVQTQMEERQKQMDLQREIDRAARERAEIHSR